MLGLEGYCSIDWRVLKFHQQRCCANSRNFAQFVPNILKWSVVFDVNDDVMVFVMMIMIANMAWLHDLSRILVVFDAKNDDDGCGDDDDASDDNSRSLARIFSNN